MGLLLGTNGCSTHRELNAIQLPPVLALNERAEAHQVITNHTAGTAVHIGDNRLWLSAHLLGDVPVIEVDGRPASFTVVDHGPEDGTFAGDWAVIKLDGLTLHSENVLDYWDPDRQPAEGARLLICGYYTPVPLDTARQRMNEMSVIEMKTKRPPWARDPQLIYAEPPDGKSYPGLSGGAVFERDERSGRFFFLGIYQGVNEYSILGQSFGIRAIVCRPPWVVTEKHKGGMAAVKRDQLAAPSS